MRVFQIFCVLPFLLAVSAFSAKPVVFDSPVSLSSQTLFAKLDSVGGGGTWMEWDASGVVDPELGKLVLDRQGGVKKNILHAWLLNVPGKPSKFAVLSKLKNGESLAFNEIGPFSTKPVPLRLSEPLDPRIVFRDYRETLAGHFVHLDDTSLQVVVRDNEIQFSYFKPDSQALSPVFNFKRLSEQQKRDEIRMRRDFYAYEYSLMVQAFVASMRGLFNWQIWHWYDKKWTVGAFIGDREIEALLASPEQGKMVRIFFLKLSDGDSVEMQSNAHGSFVMTIRR